MVTQATSNSLSNMTVAVTMVITALAATIRAQQVPAIDQAATTAGNTTQQATDILYRHPANPRLDALGDPLPPSAIVRFGTSRFQHPSSAHAAALSPDGKTYITAGSDALVAWDTATGKQLWSNSRVPSAFGLSAYGQVFLAFSESNAAFFTPGDDNQLISWDALTGEQRPLNIKSERTIEILENRLGRTSRFACIQVTRTADAFFLGGQQGLIKVDAQGKELWSLANNHLNKPAEEVEADGRSDRLWFGGHFTMLQLSPDEQSVAAVFSQAPKQLQVLDAATGKVRREIPLSANLVRCIFAPDSRTITCTERDCGLRQYDVETGERRWELVIPPAQNAESYLTDLAYIPADNREQPAAVQLTPQLTPQLTTQLAAEQAATDVDLIAVGAAIGPDNAIYLVDASDGREQGVLRGHSWKPWGLQFDPAKRVLYSTGWEGAIRLWDVDKRQQLPLPQGTRGGETLALSPDGKLAAYVDDLSTVHLVSVEDWREVRAWPVEFGSSHIVHFTADSQTLYAGGASLEELFVAGWNVHSGQATARGTWPKGRDPHSSIEELVSSKDGAVLGVAVFRQSKAYLNNARDGSQIAELPHNQVYGMDIHPAGNLAITVGWDKMIRVWSTADGSLLQQVPVVDHLDGEADVRMYGACFNGDGTQVAVAHMQGLVSVWNIDEQGAMNVAHSFEAGWFVFGAIDFSRDGYWILAGNSSGQLSLYDASNGKKVWQVEGHEDHVYTVQLHPSNRMAVSGGGGLGYAWSLIPEELPPDDFEQLYEKLLSDDGETYHAAMWALATGSAELVERLDRRLGEVTQVVDLAKLRSAETELEKKRNELALKAISTNPQIDAWHRLRLALLALSLSESPAAKAALQQLASQHPAEQIKTLASQLLHDRSDE